MKKLKDINWNQVYYFYEVARKMSMKEAAEVTGVSIPTVSEQIKRLETLLETPLFHRRPRRIELTVEGETLYKHAQQMFESGLRFLDVVSPTVIGGYPVRIGVQETFSNGAALEFLMRYFDIYSPFGTVNTFREENPDVLMDKVYGGDLDWAISLVQPTSPRIEWGKVGSTEIVFCASADKLEQFKNRTELFAALPLARSRFDDALNKLVSDHMQASDIFVEETIETDHFELAMRLVEQGKAITAVARGFQGQAALPPGVKTFSLHGPIVMTFYAYWRQTSSRMIAIRKLAELLEKDSRGLRPRSNAPTLPMGGSGSGGGVNAPGAAPSEDAPIELPHRFEESDIVKAERNRS